MKDALALSQAHEQEVRQRVADRVPGFPGYAGLTANDRNNELNERIA